MRKVVVLPQPDGPSSVTRVPEFDGEADARHRLGRAIALHDLVELDAHARAPSAGARRRPSLRPPTANWISRITASMSTIRAQL